MVSAAAGIAGRRAWSAGSVSACSRATCESWPAPGQPAGREGGERWPASESGKEVDVLQILVMQTDTTRLSSLTFAPGSN
jgi:hypothetical protein